MCIGANQHQWKTLIGREDDALFEEQAGDFAQSEIHREY